MNAFFHCVFPVPLSSCYFDSQPRLRYQIVKCIYQSQTRQCNKSDNYTRQNSPNQFQRCVMIKALRNRLQSMMKTLHNSSTQPQNQYLNHEKKENNVVMQICNTFHVRSCRILKQHLPFYRSIRMNSALIPYHRDHSFFDFLCCLWYTNEESFFLLRILPFGYSSRIRVEARAT